MFLGIKLYDLTLNLQNAPLKFKIKAFKISKTKKLLAKTAL